MQHLLHLALLTLGACRTAEQQPEPVAPRGPLVVVTTSFPAHYLAQRIGGDHLELRNILPPGEDASHWRPDTELIANLTQADLIVANGLGFEGWMATATLPEDRLVYTAAGLRRIEIVGATHSHGAGGEHSHGTTDPHSWASPRDYAHQARVLTAALAAADPDHAVDYEHAAEVLTTELAALSAGYAAAFSHAGDTRMASSAAAYHYLAREVGASIRSFDLHPDEAPSEESLATFVRWSAEAHAPVLFWESPPEATVTAAFPEGVRHVLLDPLERPGEGGYDYLGQARANIAVLDALL